MLTKPCVIPKPYLNETTPTGLFFRIIVNVLVNYTCYNIEFKYGCAQNTIGSLFCIFGKQRAVVFSV